MAMQTGRLRRAVTSLSALHRSFHSPITSAHSPIPISDLMSVQPPASFRFQSRPFSTPWYSPWKDNEAPKDENVDPEPSKEGYVDATAAANELKEILSTDDQKVSADADSLSKENDTENFLTREEIHDLLRSLKKDKDKDKDPKAFESRDENGNFIYLTKEEIDDILTTLRNDPEVIKAMNEEKEIAKEIEARKKEGKDDDDDDWTFSFDDIGKEGAGDDLFKNVKPLSEYDIDSKLEKTDHGFMDIFKKYDMKALMEKAKEQEEKEKEEMKEYEGYNFMRRRQEDYHFNFFEEEEPRVPKNEDDIMEIFAGCDLKHWLVTVDFPVDPAPKPEEMIATYERICAEGLGVSIEEAKKRIYACSTSVYKGFQVEMTKEETEKFIEIPEVMLILPDSYLDRKNEEYGGDKYENGVITHRPPPFTYKEKEKKKKDSKGEKTGDNKMKLVPPPKVGGGSVGKQGANR